MTLPGEGKAHLGVWNFWEGEGKEKLIYDPYGGYLEGRNPGQGPIRGEKVNLKKEPDPKRGCQERRSFVEKTITSLWRGSTLREGGPLGKGLALVEQEGEGEMLSSWKEVWYNSKPEGGGEGASPWCQKRNLNAGECHHKHQKGRGEGSLSP